jgi:hypothetical protein
MHLLENINGSHVDGVSLNAIERTFYLLIGLSMPFQKY